MFGAPGRESGLTLVQSRSALGGSGLRWGHAPRPGMGHTAAWSQLQAQMFPTPRYLRETEARGSHHQVVPPNPEAGPVSSHRGYRYPPTM